ncbi:MAG: helix-turn-helix transcriptional regulator [Citrobacter freundii]|nr:MAG: helix-turn-helix transcriptional regulator [Citrobacter freundii]
MRIQVAEWVKPLQLQSRPTPGDYQQAKQYLQVVEAFAQTMHQCVYIIDHYKQGFLYVSDNALFLCGRSAHEVRRAGYNFYREHVPPEEMLLLAEINEAGWKFFNQLPVGERLNYTISADFHLVQPGKRPMLINHKLTPLVLDAEDHSWLSLCVVTHSPNSDAGNIIITKRGEKQKVSFGYDLLTKEWIEQKRITLTPRQKEILALSAQGITMHEIGRILAISSDTVKLHKKNIFEKLRVKNMVEAMQYATNYNLFE